MRYGRPVAAFLWSMALSTICRADSSPSLAPLYEKPFVVIPASAPLALEIPLAQDGVEAAAVCAEKVGVRYQNFVSEAASQHFLLEQSLLAKGKGAARLRVTLPQSAAMQPGDYHLMVRFHSCGKPLAAQGPQAVYVFTIPYAALQARGKQIVDRRIALPWSDVTVNPAGISIERDGNSAFVPIRKPTIMAEPFTNASSATVGAWEVERLDTVEPYQPVRINMAAHTFPRGTANGQIVLRSEDLQSPFRIDIEVRTRLHPAWMLLPIVFGLVLGHWLRHHLQGRIDLGEARRPAIDALARFGREAKRIADPVFQLAASSILAELSRMIRNDDKTQVQAALATATVKFENLQKDLQAGLKAVTDDINAYRGAFDIVDILPPPLDALPQQTDRDARFCLELVVVGNLTDAKKELASRSRDAMGLVGEGLHSLKAAANNLYAQHKLATKVLSPESRSGLDAKRTASETAVAGIGPVTQQAEVHAALTAIAQLRYAAIGLLNLTAAALDSTARAVEDQLRARIDPNSILPPSLLTFKSALGAMATEMRTLAAANPFVPSDWPGRTAGALDALRAALLAMIAGRTDLAAQASQLQAEVNSESWYVVFAKISEYNPVHGALLAPANAPSVEVALTPAATTQAPARPALDTPVIAPLTLPEIDLEDFRNRSDLKRSRLLMTVGIGAITAFASYAVYEDKFVGNNLELLGLFIWGFSADMTLGGLFERLTPFKQIPLANDGGAAPAAQIPANSSQS